MVLLLNIYNIDSMEIISITHTFQFITKRYRVWEPQSQPHISLCNQISLKFNMFLFACDHRHARFVIQKNKTAINTHALAVANAKICLNGCQILYLFYLLFILIIHTVNAVLTSRIIRFYIANYLMTRKSHRCSSTGCEYEFDLYILFLPLLRFFSR